MLITKEKHLHTILTNFYIQLKADVIPENKYFWAQMAISLFISAMLWVAFYVTAFYYIVGFLFLALVATTCALEDKCGSAFPILMYFFSFSAVMIMPKITNAVYGLGIALFVINKVIRLIYGNIKKTEKISWHITIPYLLLGVYFCIIYLRGNYSIATLLSLGSGILLLYFIIIYKDSFKLKDMFIAYILGLLIASFIALFVVKAPNLSGFFDIQFAYNKLRFSALYSNTNVLSITLMFAFAMLFVLYLKDKIKLVYYPILFALLVIVLATMSKSVVLIFSIVLVSFFILQIIKRKNKLQAVSVCVATILIIVLSCLICSQQTKVLLNRVDVINNISTSTGTVNNSVDVGEALNNLSTGRVELWLSSLNKTFESVSNAIFGVKLGRDYNASDICEPHNTYLQYAYHVGIIGCVLLCLCIICSFSKSDIKKFGFSGLPMIMAIVLTFGICDNFSYVLFMLLGLTYLTIKYDELDYPFIEKKRLLNDSMQKDKKENEIRVLHLLSSNKYSGAENVVTQIIKMFDDEIQMAYCSPIGPIEQSLQARDIKYFGINKLSKSEVKQVIKKYKPSIIHAHDVKASILASKFADKHKIISHIHGNDKRNMGKITFKSLLYYITSKNYSKIFWVSNSCLDDFAFKKQVKNRSKVLYNIIDTKELAYKANKDKNNYNCDICYLGRLTDVKNPLRVLEIMQGVIAKKPDTKCMVIGDGNLMEDCKAFVNQHNLQNNITMCGFLSNPYKILSQSKLMLMSSINEGLPMVLLESFSLGVPLVSTRVDGAVELIDNDLMGNLYDTNEEAVNYILNIINSDDQQRKQYLKEFSKNYNNIEHYKQQIMLAYKN